MKVFVITHDQGVDGGRAIEVRSTVDGAITFVEGLVKERYPNVKRQGDQLYWDSLGDAFFIDEFEVGD
jgi:hypothetical protein